MRDYTLAIGGDDPYGFSATHDQAALAHAVDYLGEGPDGRPSRDDRPLTLSGPDGLLTSEDERVGAFRRRVPAHFSYATDDVRPGDPTPPDCNVSERGYPIAS